MKKFIIGILCISWLGMGCFKDEKKPVMPQESPAVMQVSLKIKENPNDPDLYVSRARLLAEESRYPDAIRDMKKALAFDSSHIATRHELSDLYFDNEQDEEAIQVLEQTIDLFPASQVSLLKLSEFQYLLQKNEAALHTLQQLKNINPKNPEIYYMQGRVLFQQGEKEKATQAFHKALSVYDKHSDSLLELGTIYSQDKNKEGLKYLKRALALAPNNPEIIFEIGNYYRFQGDDANALRQYKEVALKHPQFTEAHINAGIIHFEKKAYPIANNLFNIAVETDPTSAAAYYYRGMSYLNMGKNELAQADFNRAITLDKSYKEIIDNE